MSPIATFTGCWMMWGNTVVVGAKQTKIAPNDGAAGPCGGAILTVRAVIASNTAEGGLGT
jgi:hypothetical protein